MRYTGRIHAVCVRPSTNLRRVPRALYVAVRRLGVPAVGVAAKAALPILHAGVREAFLAAGLNTLLRCVGGALCQRAVQIERAIRVSKPADVLGAADGVPLRSRSPSSGSRHAGGTGRN